MSGKNEQEPDDIWTDALNGADLDSLGKGKGAEYPTFQPDQISDAMERNPIEGILMRMANDQSRRVRAQAEGETARKKEYHSMGWRLSIQTSKGVIGLQNSWVGNNINLSFPNGIIPEDNIDQLITKVLEVEPARPVRVSKNAAGEETPGEEVVDSEKFLRERDPHTLLDGIYTRRSKTMFAKFYGPIEATGGRVWVDRHASHATNFRYVEGGELKETDYWRETADAVFTFPSKLHGDFAPEGPTTDEKAIQRYRDKFIHLASELALLQGGVKALDVNFEFTVLTPEDLYREGYEDIQWIKGDLGERKGFGQEAVKGRKGNSTVYLESANEIVPWSMVLHAPVSNIMSPQVLADLIRVDLLWF